MPVLAYRLFGYAASCGTSGSGGVRRVTARRFGRAAVLGQVAAACGIDRGDQAAHDRLRAALMVAVAANGPRRVVTDFRTIQTVADHDGGPLVFANRGAALRYAAEHHKSDVLQTKLTQREHVEDGLWRVFLAPRPGVPDAEAVLEQARAALRRPVFGVYLGRREFPPTLPLDPQVIDGGLLDAVGAYEAIPAPAAPSMEAMCRTMRRALRPWDGTDLHWFDAAFPGVPPALSRTLAREEPLDRVTRLFGECDEFYARVYEEDGRAHLRKPTRKPQQSTPDDAAFFDEFEEDDDAEDAFAADVAAVTGSDAGGEAGDDAFFDDN